jgi:hypothetical protein
MTNLTAICDLHPSDHELALAGEHDAVLHTRKAVDN